MRLSVFGVATQQDALKQLAELTQRSTVHPLVRQIAMQITAGCQSRDDLCELQAIFDAVKHGDPRVRELRNGVRYVADPRWADFFTAPYRLLKQCAKGACAGDCDDHAALIAALAGSLGFVVGLRVWGPKPNEFTHVYAVAGVPKRDPRQCVGLDSTVDESDVGWEPPQGEVLTAWLDPPLGDNEFDPAS